MRFQLEMQDKITVKDVKNKFGEYTIVGRSWSRKKGIIYELKPEPTTALQFYRLFLKEEIIKKKNKLLTAIISGSQFKKLKSRQVIDIGFVQW